MVATSMTALREHAVQDLSQNFWRSVAGLAGLIQVWRNRQRQRRDLARMSEHMLRDIGLTPGEAMDEMAKPFWRA